MVAALVGACLWVLTTPSHSDAQRVDSALAGEAEPAPDPSGPPSPRSRAADPASSSTDVPVRTSSARASAVRDAAAAARPWRPAPDRLRVPALDADMRVKPVGVTGDRGMAVPADPSVAGWYRWSSRPGQRGASVITAHVDAEGVGAGPLARLRTLDTGDEVVVGSGRDARRYVVRDVLQVGKEDLDTGLLFRRDGSEALHLLTCGGDFDPETRHYDDNVVVVATPARGARG